MGESTIISTCISIRSTAKAIIALFLFINQQIIAQGVHDPITNHVIELIQQERQKSDVNIPLRTSQPLKELAEYISLSGSDIDSSLIYCSYWGIVSVRTIEPNPTIVVDSFLSKNRKLILLNGKNMKLEYYGVAINNQYSIIVLADSVDHKLNEELLAKELDLNKLRRYERLEASIEQKRKDITHQIKENYPTKHELIQQAITEVELEKLLTPEELNFHINEQEEYRIQQKLYLRDELLAYIRQKKIQLKK